MYQTDPPIPPKESLPTMYDLPSEDPLDPGLPDEFHIYQPQLLEESFRPPTYSAEEIFVASDLNIYYNSRNPLWHKRPDWFAVVGTSRFYEQRDLRLSYVIWQEGISPFVAVELLSPGTEKEDLVDIPPRPEVRGSLNASLGCATEVVLPSLDVRLKSPNALWRLFKFYHNSQKSRPIRTGLESHFFGQSLRIVEADKPPTKWQVYEQILRVPYYIVFDRYTDNLRAFVLQADSYKELNLEQPRIWMPRLEIGLGLWQGNYKGIERLWLRWYDNNGNWLPTPAEQERQRAERFAAKLRELGVNPDEL